MSPLRLLGTPRAFVHGQPRDLPFDKPTALLVYLACRDGWASRDELVGLLWEELDESRAKANLRQTLYKLQQPGWLKGLETERARVRLELESDRDDFKAAFDLSDWGGAVEHYTGPFLDGFRLAGAPAFEAWCETERRGLHHLWQEAALAHADGLERGAHFAEAARLMQRVLMYDPLAEEALRRYMRAAARARPSF